MRLPVSANESIFICLGLAIPHSLDPLPPVKDRALLLRGVLSFHAAMPFLDLPVEIIWNIQSFLFPFEVLRVSHVSRALRSTLEPEVLKIKQSFEDMMKPESHRIWEIDEGTYDYDDWLKQSYSRSTYIRAISERDLYKRHVLVESRVGGYLDSIDTRGIARMLYQFHGCNKFLRHYQQDWENIHAVNQGPHCPDDSDFLLPFRVLALPSVVYLQINNGMDIFRSFAEMLVKANLGAQSKLWFPELQKLELVTYSRKVWGDGVNMGAIEEISRALEFFDRCERRVRIQSDTGSELDFHTICKIDIPAKGVEGHIQVEFKSCEYPDELEEAFEVAPAILAPFKEARQWTFVDDGASRHNTQLIFKEWSEVNFTSISIPSSEL